MKKILIVLLFPYLLFSSQKIKVALNWETQFEFAAFYVAKEKGFYKEVGIDVDIIPLDITHPIDLTQSVLKRKVDIAIGYSSIIPQAITTNKIQVLTYLFQTSPLIGISKEAIENISAKNCLYLSKNEKNSSLDLLVTKLGVNCKKQYSIFAFEQDKKGIISSFISNEALILKEHYFLEPRLYGYDFYDDILFTSKTFYTTHTKTVRNFILATLKGWRYAFRHIQESATIVSKYTKKKTIQQLITEAKTLLRYSIFSLDKVGLFNKEKLKKMISLYEENGILKRKKTLYQFIDALFIDSIDLSWQERALIANTPITYSETNWPPFTMVESGKMQGLIQDYIDIIAQKTGLEFFYIPYNSWSSVLTDIKNKKLAMAMATGETPQRKKWAIFSDPYGKYSFALASRRDAIITDISQLDGKIIAAGENYTALEVLKHYKGVKIKVVKNTQEALALLEKAKIDGVVDILPTLSYFMAIGNYKKSIISLTLEEKFILKGMFAKGYEKIVTIFNKALHTITNEQRRMISQKYSNKIVYQYNKEKEQFFIVVMIILFFLVIVFAYMIFRLQQELKRRKKAENELEELVNHDPLTGLYNRRFFHHLLEHDLKNVKRYGGYIVFAIYDVDNFKKYNDYYGHQKGDEVLIAISQKMQELCKRENDFLFRLGGEEFGVYTRVENSFNQKQFLQSLVKHIEQLAIEHKYNSPYGVVTISLGAVIVHIERGKRYPLEKLYAKADSFMYQAKKEGKNKAIIELIKADGNKK